MNFMWVAYPRFRHIWGEFAISIVKQKSTEWVDTIPIDWYHLKCPRLSQNWPIVNSGWDALTLLFYVVEMLKFYPDIENDIDG
jgi:hypothetical protein